MTPEQRREALAVVAAIRHESGVHNYVHTEVAANMVERWIAEARADERRNTAARIMSRFGALADRAGEVGHYERAAFYSDAERIARDEAGGGQP